MQEEYFILKNNLKLLGLYTISEQFLAESTKAMKDNINYIEYLNRLIEAQITTKVERSVNYKIRSAKFPCIKTKESFDFSFQPSIEEKKIIDLANLDFIKKNENILFIGPPGVGKTHLAISLGFEACKKRIRNLFITAKDLIDNLLIASYNRTIQQEIDKYARYPLLIIDELGFLPIAKEASNLLFQLISRKYEHSSIIITTNKPFGEWGDMFCDDIIASAIIDRLVHHSHIIKIMGKSYRVKEKLAVNADNKEMKNKKID